MANPMDAATEAMVEKSGASSWRSRVALVLGIIELILGIASVINKEATCTVGGILLIVGALIIILMEVATCIPFLGFIDKPFRGNFYWAKFGASVVLALIPLISECFVTLVIVGVVVGLLVALVYLAYGLFVIYAKQHAASTGANFLSQALGR